MFKLMNSVDGSLIGYFSSGLLVSSFVEKRSLDEAYWALNLGTGTLHALLIDETHGLLWTV